MIQKRNKLVVAITGASGSIYAKVLLDKLNALPTKPEVGIVMSDNAKTVWQLELGNKDYETYPFRHYDKNDFNAPFASGSAKYESLIVCPCSMGTMARIATGVSNDLIARCADVMLKERRRLILVTRDTPLNLIHISNMRTVTEAGGIICPASPSFYSKPKTFEDLAATVVDRVLSLSCIDTTSFEWGS